jgi:hypothetical protein
LEFDLILVIIEELRSPRQSPNSDAKKRKSDSVGGPKSHVKNSEQLKKSGLTDDESLLNNFFVMKRNNKEDGYTMYNLLASMDAREYLESKGLVTNVYDEYNKLYIDKYRLVVRDKLQQVDIKSGETMPSIPTVVDSMIC